MRKPLLAGLLFIPTLFIAQSWTKISTNFDSLWTNSVKYYNKGDTIIYYGSTQGTNSFSPKRFFVSTDGGYTFNRDFTNLDLIGYEAFYSLPINNLLLGFKNSPNTGTYKFGAINNWQGLFVNGSGYGVWGDLASNTLLFQPFGNSNIYSFNLINNTLGTAVITGTNSMTLRTIYNSGNRTLLGGQGVKYFDGGNTSMVQTASGITGTVFRFFKGNNVLYAVVNTGNDNLYKSIDNGSTWTLQTTTFLNGTNTNTLVSAYTLGTPNGNIFYLETNSGASNNVFLSTDGGQTATKIPNGLPSNGSLITPTTGKLLTNGNKVWYQVCKANNVDFVRTDTSIAGLYQFNNTVGINELQHHKLNFSIYPNPAKESINIKIENRQEELITISILNILGETLFTESVKSNIFTLKPNNLNRGVYFITLTAGNYLSTKKIIIE